MSLDLVILGEYARHGSKEVVGISPAFVIEGLVLSDSPILLDASRLLWRAWRGQLPTGIDRACIAYAERYGDRSRAVVQRGGITFTLSSLESRALFSLLIKRPTSFRRDVVKLLARSAFRRAITPAPLISGNLYFNIGHTGLDRMGHRRWIAKSGVRPVYYVHDLIPITHPQYTRQGETERHIARMTTVLHCGAALIANSHDSIERLAAFASEHGIAMPPTLPAPLGMEPFIAKPATNSPLATSYFVVLGTIEGRKNHALLLDVWRKLAERMGNATPKLVIIGQRGWAADDVIATLDSDALLGTHVIELGRCGDKELVNWLAHARALLFPSIVEGQGLPLVEALALGTPVIASDLGVFRETAKDIPEYIDPFDRTGWLGAIEDYTISPENRRARQIERMHDFAPPNWDDHFAAVNAWLEKLGLMSWRA